MKNTFGSSVSVTLFGESHGAAIGAVLDGIAPGIEIDEKFIEKQMRLRKGESNISTGRSEADKVKIVSGVFNGKTTGTPICFMIENQDQHSSDYEKSAGALRPSHADYTARCKYNGFEDYRGGGHFSGRITAGLVAAGTVAIKALEKKGILIGTHILNCNGVKDKCFTPTEEELKLLSDKAFPVIDNAAADEMKKRIEEAKAEGDSIGGVLQTAVIGLPSGVGEPWFDTLEGVLAHGIFSIPAVKGIEFGLGFGFADLKGSEANDEFIIENESIKTSTNNNGGINGGISNGMPIVFNTAIKPTPSIFKEQKTVDINTGSETMLKIQGRHDPAIIHRAKVVVDSVTALVLCDMLAQKYGTDFLGA